MITMGQAILPHLDDETRIAYATLIEERFGLRLTQSQVRELDRVVADVCTRTRVGSSRGPATPRHLYRSLAAGSDADVLEAIAAKLTIGETHFMRVEPQMEALQRTVFPRLIGARRAERRLNLWSAGCSTGEEPYTVAMLLLEQGVAAPCWDVRFVATDINDTALDTARAGLYGAWSFRGTSEDLRRRYFVPEGQRWRVRGPVRDMVHFSHMNLAANMLPDIGEDKARFDLILCRNVTIYFGAEAAQRLYQRLRAALADDGWLVLGPSDPVPEPDSGLLPVTLPGAVLWQPDDPAASQRGTRTRHHRTGALPTGGSGSRASPRGESRGTTGRTRNRPRHPQAPHTGTVAPVPAVSASGREGVIPPEVWQLIREGELDTALDCAGRLATSNPLDADAHMLVGMLYLDTGEPGRALDSLRRATFLDQHNPLAYYALGRAHALLGHTHRAVAALLHARRVLAQTPADAPVGRHDELLAGDLGHAVERQLSGLMGSGTSGTLNGNERSSYA